MSDNLTRRDQIILAAVTSVPAGTDDEWEAQVRNRAMNIAAMLGERSSVSRALERMEGASVFVGTIVGGRIEQSSTRMQIDIMTDKAEGKIEQIRTDRTDSPEGKAVANLARSLKGHRVLVYKGMEQMAGSQDRKVRVLVHLVDLGVDADQAQPTAA